MKKESKGSLKDKLKASVGKVKRWVKSGKENVGQEVQAGKRKLDKKYDSGVGKVQQSTLGDKLASMSDGLTKRDEKELLSNKDGTFRKIRKAFIGGTVLITPFIIGIPIKMIDEAIQNKVDLKHAEEYDKIYERELLWVDAEIAERKKKGKDTKDLEQYRESIKKAKAKTEIYMEKIKAQDKKQKEDKEATKEAMDVRFNYATLPALERFTRIRPEYFDSEDQFDNILIESFKEMLYDASHSIPYEPLKSISGSSQESIKEEKNVDIGARRSANIISNGIIINTLGADRNLTSAIESQCTSGGKAIFNRGDCNKLNLIGFDFEKSKGRPQEMTAKLEKMVENINTKLKYTGCNVVLEKSDTINPVLVLESITSKAEDVVRSGVHAARNVVPDESPVKRAERASEPLDNAVNKIIKSVRDGLRSDANRKIVDGGQYRFKLIRIIAKCIAYGGLAYIHPALAAIAFLGKMAFDKHVESSERAKIVHDLKSELEITEEKIKDAQAKGDNESKYKLMRIRKSLETEVNRISLHLDK